MLTISGKALGRKKALFADWAIPLPPDMQGEEGTSLRDVISRIVREEVRAFKERQADRRLLRALTARQIDEQRRNSNHLRSEGCRARAEKDRTQEGREPAAKGEVTK